MWGEYMLISEDKYAAILNFIQELFDTSFDDKLRSVVFDAPSLDHEAIRLYFDSFDNIYYMGHIFTEEDYLFPFYPYLKVIKDYFSGLPRQETKTIIESLNLYALHQNLYLNFIYDEDFSRQEEILRDEVYYEKKLFLVDIGKLLNHIAGFEDIVIYLGELQYAPESTLDMTKYLLEECISMPILLVGVLDADYLEYEENKDSHQDFVEALDRLDLMVRIDVEFVDESPYYKRGGQNKEEIYRIMEVCFQFLAISDCIYYGKQLYVTYNNQLNKGEEGQFIDLLKLLGKAHFLNRDKEGALFYDNMAYSLAESIGHQWNMCLCKINLGYDYSINGQFAIARKHANEAYEMADDLGYEALAYKAMLMNFVIDKESLYIESTTTEEQLETLIEGTIERGYNNFLAMIYTNPRELHHNFDAVKESRFALGIQLASQTGNDHQLGVAYHNQGIIYYQLGQIHLSFEYLQKSKLIKERIGDKKRLSYIYNSLGYYYFLIESYSKAHDEYLKSLIASGESGDYHEVCMTLYNMALNAFFYGKYTLVCNYISKLLDLMKVAKLQDIKYHSKKMIYDIYIIALVKTGHMSKARDIYNKVGIWKLKPIEDKDEEYFISEMMEFFMSHVEEDKEELLVKAELYIPESDASLLHFRKFYFWRRCSITRLEEVITINA